MAGSVYVTMSPGAGASVRNGYTGYVIVGLGTDILEVARLRLAMERRGERLLNRLFTPEERAYCESRVHAAEHFAARFAAKEATMKALGTGWRGGIAWRDIEVVREESGRPTLLLAGRAKERADALGVSAAHVTLTHDDTYGMAVVILEKA
jgi:holo-[acyl-carrier protein] synthase